MHCVYRMLGTYFFRLQNGQHFYWDTGAFPLSAFGIVRTIDEEQTPTPNPTLPQGKREKKEREKDNSVIPAISAPQWIAAVTCSHCQ